MKTPQQKKQLSYAKDRRNVYGANSGASRKGIPLAKARANRAERHLQDTLLTTAIASHTDDQLAQIEGQVKGTPPRRWRKAADKPLGEVLANKASRKSALKST